MKPEPERDEKRAMGGELIIPLMALGFTLYYFSTIVDSPWTAQVNAFLVGSVLIVLVLAFLAVTAREVILGRATLGASNLLAPTDILPKRAGFIALTLAYLVAIDWLGFTLTTFLFLVGAMLLLNNGRRPRLCFGLAAGLSAVAYGVFILLFETRLPRGPIEQALAAIF